MSGVLVSIEVSAGLCTTIVYTASNVTKYLEMFHPTLSTSPATIFPLIPIIAGAVGMVLLCCSVIAVVSIIVVISKRRRKKPAISTYEMNIVIQNPHSGTCVFIALLTCTNT